MTHCPMFLGTEKAMVGFEGSLDALRTGLSMVSKVCLMARRPMSRGWYSQWIKTLLEPVLVVGWWVGFVAFLSRDAAASRKMGWISSVEYPLFRRWVKKAAVVLI